MKRRVLVLAGSRAQREKLVKILERLPAELEIFKVANPGEAFHILANVRMHLFLLDVMPDRNNPSDVSGLRFAYWLREIPYYKFTPIIFITSLEDPELFSYAALHCYQYIEKPFSVSQLGNAVLNALEFPVAEDENRKVFFRNGGVIYCKRIGEIVYFECMRREVHVCFVDDELRLAYMSMTKLLKKLDSDLFVQCSRYVAVNRNHIEAIDYTNRYIKMKYYDSVIEIGRVIGKRFRQKMEDW